MSGIDSSMAVEYRTIGRLPGYRFGAEGTVWSQWHALKGKTRVNFLGLPPDDSEWRRLQPRTEKTGYLSVGIKVSGFRNKKRMLVHRLILEAFSGNLPDGMQVRHFPDPNRANNRIENLSWGTPQQNMDDRIVHGTTMRGERHPRARITWDIVQEIRRLKSQKVPTQVLMDRFGLSKTMINTIHRRLAWIHKN